MVFREFSQTFALDNRAIIRQKTAGKFQFSELDEPVDDGVRLAGGQTQLSGDIARIELQLPTMHVDEIKQHPICRLQLE